MGQIQLKRTNCQWFTTTISKKPMLKAKNPDSNHPNLGGSNKIETGGSDWIETGGSD